jgi:hypothetical protein
MSFLNQFFFFFEFHLSTLSWLRIEFYNLFQFSFYWVISISWPVLQAWHVDSVCWLEIEFYNLFQFFSYWVISISWPVSQVWQVDSFFFSSFNIRFFFIEFYNLFWFVFFLWGYHGLMTRYGDWQVNSTWVKSIQYVIVLIFTHTRKSHLKYLF